MKRLFLILASLLLPLVILFLAQIRLGILTAFFIWDVLHPGEAHVAARLGWMPVPVVKEVAIPRRGESLRADLYRVPNKTSQAGILLTHGMIEAGKNDPRLIHFARSLARSGFVVLVPELSGMKSLRVLLSDVEDIVIAFRYLGSLENGVDERKMGLLGFSYGAGPTLLAAAHPDIRQRVKFVASFGGYYDPVNVIRFITTGYYEYGGERGFGKPEPYGRWIFYMNQLDSVKSERDRQRLKALFSGEGRMETKQQLALRAGLSPSGRALYELLTNKDPNRVEDLVKRTDGSFQTYLKSLSLAPIVPLVPAYFIIGHGKGDPLIPYTESLRLADAVPKRRQVHVAVLDLFTHVDPAEAKFRAEEWVTVYLPSLLRFYSLIYDLLRQG